MSSGTSGASRRRRDSTSNVFAAGSERGNRPRLRRTKPLRRRGHPRQGAVVVLRDLPPCHEGLLDDRAISSDKTEVGVHGARDPVQWRGRAAVPGTKGQHHSPLVHLRAKPLRDAALADARFADERHQILPLRTAGNEVYRVPEFALLLTASHEHRCAQAQDSGRQRARIPDRRGPRSWLASYYLFEGRRVLRLDLAPVSPCVRREFVAVPGLLLEEPEDEFARLPRNLLRQARGRRSGSFVCAQHVLRVALEDLVPAEHPVHDATECVEVRGGTDERGLPANLLGSHPSHGPCPRMHGDFGCAGAVEARVVPIFAQPREAKVEHAGPWPPPRGGQVEHDVRWLQIAVDNAASMGVRKPCEHLVDHRPHDAPR